MSMPSSKRGFDGRIWVAVVTRRRPERLRMLLDSLSRLDPPGPTVSFLIVDNDPERSAESVVNKARTTLRDVTYVHEPRQGIPFARNRALGVADDNDVLAFIDDDEVADRRWLASLWTVMDWYDSDVVAGPVVTLPPDGSPTWIIDGGFLDRPNPEDGVRRETAATGNVMMRVSAIRALGLSFDETFPLLGGEDTWLFRQLTSMGGDIRWAHNALAHENVPSSRATPMWLIRRAFRGGYAPAVRRMCVSRRRATIVEFGRFGYRMLDGCRLFIVGIPRGRAGVLRASQRFASAAGGLWGVIGGHYVEYATTD